MKKAIFLVIVFLTSMPIKSQDNLPLIYNNMDDICEGDLDAGKKSAGWRDGILHLGNTIVDTLTGMRGFTIIYYDTLGTMLWNKVYSDSNYYILQGNDILAIDSNYFYVGGIFYDETMTPWDSFIAKFDQNGDTLYFQKYCDTASLYLIDIEKFAQDTLLILSVWQEIINSSFTKIVLSLADTNGNIFLTMQDSLNQKHPRESLVHNGQIYIGGTKRTNPSSNFHYKVFINRYDLNLNYLGSTTPSLTLNELFRSFTVMNNNLFITSCITLWFPPDPNAHWSINISRLTYEGILIDTNTFGPHNGWMEFGAKTININNELFLTFINGNYVEMYFHDLNLNPLCNYVLPRPAENLDIAYIFDIEYLPPNKITGNGWTFSDTFGGIQNQWNFLTDDILTFLYSYCQYVSAGELVQECNRFQVLQNVTNNTATIRNQAADQDSKVLVRLFDINGRLVLTDDFYQEVVIKFGLLSKGIYIMHLICNGQTEAHKLIVF